MRYAFIADIHSNLPALEAVFGFLKTQPVDAVICLGDVIGYAGHPRECIDFLARQQVSTLLGNHDAGAAGKLSISYFNPYAQQALEWTRKQLSDQDIRFLGALPLQIITEQAVLVHASCASPGSFPYLVSPENTIESFAWLKEKGYLLSFIGHTHIPGAFMDNGKKTRFARGPEIVLEKKKRYIINVGSVGQPRDHDARSCCCIYNSTRGLIQWIRLDYDIRRTQERIYDVGLPRFLAERLSSGS